ncbi:MAG: hypothetical protein ACOYBY_18530 [Dermatophilaceae bacterium]
MTSKLADPRFRSDRASLAGRASHALPALIGRIERRSNELTDEDRERLAKLAR